MLEFTRTGKMKARVDFGDTLSRVVMFAFKMLTT